tara:strand:+ start:2284 stop:3006 length:723 start_codon:yes stop_codon:yes gene_type:complete
MINVYLIGYGAWGKKVFKALKKIKKINKIFIKKNRKDNKKINLKNIDWVFVATNINQHYNIAKQYLNKKINVFCEKPLTQNLIRDKKLFSLAKQKNCKLYVSDIENYKKFKLVLKKNNYISRYKLSNNKNNILERLAYHDFTYICEKFKIFKIHKVIITSLKKGEISFKLKMKNKYFYFSYSLNSKKNIHSFNKKNLRVKKNILKIMIEDVISEKVDYSKNKKNALFANSAINLIKQSSP